jgi:hypothetical protein
MLLRLENPQALFLVEKKNLQQEIKKAQGFTPRHSGLSLIIRIHLWAARPTDVIKGVWL